MAGEGPSYIGNVKSFNQAKGWGFIECAETQAIYGTDVFLLRGQILNNADIGRGDQVSFHVQQGDKGAQASNVQVLQSASTPDGQPATVQGPYRGVIKNFSIEKGYGFIACEVTHQQFGKDIFIMKSELPNTPVPDGVEVSFFVRIGEKGPQATRVQVDFGKGGCGGGKGKYGGGESYGKGCKGMYDAYGKGASCGKGYGYSSAGYDASGYGYGGDGYGAYPADGYGCGMDASYASGYGGGQDGYGGYPGGKDGYGAGYAGGKDGGYGASYGKDGYGPVYGGGKDGGYGCGYGGKDAGYGLGYGKDAGGYKGVESGAGWGNASAAFGAQGSYDMCKGGKDGWGGCGACGKGLPNESQVYFGTIKLVHAEKGWGLIACDAVHKIIGKEVFVMKSNMDLCPGLTQGSPVMFSVQNGPKGPHGINVRQAPDAVQTFTGTVRSYNSLKGWGFIDCPESAQIFQGDVFVHANALNGAVPGAGEQISFTVDTSKGRPAAANVVLAGGASATNGATPAGCCTAQGGYGPADGTSGLSAQYSPY